MRSNMAIAGHPVHPLLVTLPVGLFVWTLAADVVYLIVNDTNWFSIARWSGIAAIVSAIVAAIPGFGDFLTLPLQGKVRVFATTHMLLNLTIVALYIAAAGLMFGGDVALAGVRLWIVVALHAVGTALLLVSGWLGGEMVYRYHIGMIPRVREEVTVDDREQVRP